MVNTANDVEAMYRREEGALKIFWYNIRDVREVESRRVRLVLH